MYVPWLSRDSNSSPEEAQLLGAVCGAEVNLPSELSFYSLSKLQPSLDLFVSLFPILPQTAVDGIIQHKSREILWIQLV